MVRVDTGTGRVGIGTTSPDTLLHIEAADAPTFKIEDTTHNATLQASAIDSSVFIGATSNHAFNLRTNNTNRVTIKNTGAVGINNQSPSEKLDVGGNIKARDKITSTTFESGFAGSGFRIETGSSGTLFTVDDLTVRGQMNVFELLIHQVRATNGSLFVSNTGKIASASLSSVDNHYSMSFDTGSGYGHSFIVGDLVRAQRFVPSTNGSGSQVFKSDLHIISVNGTGSAVGVLTASVEEQHPLSQSAPQPGYEYVRIGSTTTADRQGSIYLTADDDNAPFIDVVDELTAHSQFNTSGKTKVRIGKLSGIGTTTFGTLPGYGFYASGSAFLEGSINATSGKIAEFSIDSSSISSSNNNLILRSDGQITASAADLSGKITATAGEIGGFIIDGHSLTTTGVEINNSTQGIFISSSNFKVSHTGDITASNVDLSGKINAASGEIGGFLIGSDELNAESQNFKIHTGTSSLQLGTISGSQNTSGTAKGLFASGSGYFFVGAEDGDFIKFDETTGNIAISSSDLQVEVGDLKITASQIDMSTDQFELSSSGIQLSSTHNSMSLGNSGGSGSAIVLQGGTDAIIKSRNKDSIEDTTAGFFLANLDGEAPQFAVGDGSSFIKYNSVGATLNIQAQSASISGSNVEIQSPTVFLGEGNSNFISASNSNIEISSSGFHLKPEGDVILKGSITASSGKIGGFEIGSTTLTSFSQSAGVNTNLSLFQISASAVPGELVLSSSNFKVTNEGQITASAVSMSGTIVANDGTIGGFNITDSHISASDGGILLSGSGEGILAKGNIQMLD